MCELLGMSANVPTDICFSFTGLAQRGGRTGPHADGWGISFYEGKGCRTFKDSLSSCDSRVAELVRQYPIKSLSVIGHIRQANRGGISLANTHPFIREMWGQNWTFAHNGQLHDYDDLETSFYQPIGETDSELAFCWIMDKLRHKFAQQPQDSVVVFAYVAELAEHLAKKGVYNMLLSNGDYLFAFCGNNLHWITRRAPFGEAQLIDEDVTIDFAEETTPNDIVTVIATRPLTDNEEWNQMTPGQYQLFRLGEAVHC